MRIAFVGKICSGKTWCVNYLKGLDERFYVTRFAKMVKKIATELFFMEEKDRLLLQQIGTKMREIRTDVYVNYVIKECEDEEFCLLDDARYINEIKRLKETGWILVKLNIPPELQRKRIIACYPDTFEEHLSRLTHESETQSDMLPPETFDYIINVDVDDDIIKKKINDIYNECRIECS